MPRLTSLAIPARTHSRRTHRVRAASILAAAFPLASAVAQCPIMFGAPVSSPAGPAYLSGNELITGDFLTGDFNADGLSDVAYTATGNLVVRLGNGALGFAPPTVIPAASITSLAITDTDADGRDDIVWLSIVGQLRLVRGSNTQPGGVLAPVPFNSTGVSSTALCVGDLNGDGHDDFAAARPYQGPISHFGDGAGSSLFTVAHSCSCAALAVALDTLIGDFDGNGRGDLATVSSNELFVYQGGGPLADAGSYADGLLQNALSFPVPPGASAIAKGDLNADGRDDIVVAGAGGTSLWLYLGSAATVLRAPTPLGLPGHPTAVTLADLDDDGRLDIVAACPAEDLVCVLKGSGIGTFAPALSFPAGVAPFRVVTGKFSDPGARRPDIAVINAEGVVSVLPLSTGAPQIATQPSSSTGTLGGAMTFAVVPTPTSGRVSYSWRRNGQPLAPSEQFYGVDTSTLVIYGLSASDNNTAYQCVLRNACGETFSAPVSLAVIAHCTADFNQDGDVNPDDLGDFITTFFGEGGCD